MVPWITISDWFGFGANVLQYAGTFVAIAAWAVAKRIEKKADAERERLAAPVRVIVRLQGGEKEITLPLEMTRQELTRAELLGRLGMATAGARYTLRWLATTDFLKALRAAQASSGEAEIVIPVSETEIAQFVI